MRTATLVCLSPNREGTSEASACTTDRMRNGLDQDAWIESGATTAESCRMGKPEGECPAMGDNLVPAVSSEPFSVSVLLVNKPHRTHLLNPDAACHSELYIAP